MTQATHCSECGRKLIWHDTRLYREDPFSPPDGWINHHADCSRRGEAPDVTEDEVAND